MADANDSGENKSGGKQNSDAGEQKKSGKAEQGNGTTTSSAKDSDLKANWTQYL